MRNVRMHLFSITDHMIQCEEPASEREEENKRKGRKRERKGSRKGRGRRKEETNEQ